MERKQFQTEMEVTGRISIDPNDDWLSARLRAVSTEEMNNTLGKVKKDQGRHICWLLNGSLSREECRDGHPGCPGLRCQCHGRGSP